MDPEALDVDALLAPLPGPDPAGDPEPAGEWALKQTRRQILKDEEAWQETDDARDQVIEYAAARPRWEEIARAAADILRTQSKHLEVATHLAEAVTRARGLPGLRDGLRLLHRLAAGCWDRLHPKPAAGGDDDDDRRAGAFQWLNEEGSGARFPATVARQPLFVAKQAGPFCYLDSVSKARRDAFEAAVPQFAADGIRQAHADLAAARDALRDLADELAKDARLGDAAPTFLNADRPGSLGPAIDRCLDLVARVARDRGVPLGDAAAPAAAADPAPAAANGAAAPAVTPVAPPAGATRADLYRQLRHLADALRVLEPHSPVPFLLDRCVRLGELPFPQLMRAIITEAATIEALDRLIGADRAAGGEPGG